MTSTSAQAVALEIAQKIVTSNEWLDEKANSIAAEEEGFDWRKLETMIAAALESYAEARVKEAINMSYQGGLIWKDYIENEAQELADEQNEKHYLEGREEALEEAAKLVDDHSSGKRLQAIGVADAIRALYRPPHDGGASKSSAEKPLEKSK